MRPVARVLVTRPMPAARRSAERIAGLGHEVHMAPLLAFRPLPPDAGALPAADRVGALAVTSARAFEALAGMALPGGYSDLPVFAVGGATADAARAAGFRRVAGAEGSLSGLVARIAAARPRAPVLYLAGRERSGDLAADLGRAGLDCLLVETYAMEPLDEIPLPVRSALAAGDDSTPVLAPVYSRRSGAALAEALRRWPERPAFRFPSISAQAGAPLRDLGPVDTAARSDEDALLDLLPGPDR